ncbi:helix-turn-helix transcriptional regulator [Tenacibaculum maritimum]|uniref:helix-turn-helix transcriptional regulator n=1 Tax=Tenacibaculum maritimum TaxID=107401 RepID=UPI0038775293
MYNTNLHIVTLIYIIIETFIIIFSTVIIIKENKRFTQRFLILSLLCILYNLSNGLIPNNNIMVDIRSQYYFTFAIGVTTASYLFYYIHENHDLKIFNKEFVFKIIVGFVVWYMISFVSLYSFTNNLMLSRYVFFFYPIAISFYWFYKFKRWFKKIIPNNLTHYKKLMIYTGVLAMLFLFVFPAILIGFEENQWLERTIFNLSYFSVTFFFIKKIISERDIITRINDNNYILTKREKEVVLKVYENELKTYKDLSEDMNISLSTFTTHTTKIYKVFNLSNKTKEGLIVFLKNLD